MKISNSYLDGAINNTTFQEISKKTFTAKTSYFLARAFDKLQREAKIYLSEKQKLIEKYAERHEEDGDGFKKGDMVINGDSVNITDVNKFVAEINELNSIELDIGIDKVKFDLDTEPSCTVEEMSLLLPLLEVE